MSAVDAFGDRGGTFGQFPRAGKKCDCDPVRSPPVSPTAVMSPVSVIAFPATSTALWRDLPDACVDDVYVGALKGIFAAQAASGVDR
ncbi:hypothetical protein [Micromonospora sediminicola]|uniref:hypothetical protein n=1 Tax=Micromonospora sediminicola TaxID=946078 RepID=UPI00378748DC